MILISPSFENNGALPKKFTCDGGGINPELRIENVPAEAESLALVFHDPDAPAPGGFTHWVLWNISPATTLIKEESTPPGAITGRSSHGAEYVAPCPPPGHGAHHYEFSLYALNTTLDLPVASGKAELMKAMKGHIIETAGLTGIYERQGKEDN